MPQRNKSALSEMGELDVVMCLTVVKFFLENEFHMNSISLKSIFQKDILSNLEQMEIYLVDQIQEGRETIFALYN